MLIERLTYPFSAIVGQERMKLALLLNAVNPAIGGVLIRGDRGTAKSTAVRALAGLLPEQSAVEGCQFGCDPDDLEALCNECRARLSRNGHPLPRKSRRMRVVELPINASEDRVVGTIDLEAALVKGEKRFEHGVLGDAHRNLLYVDEVNLLDDHIVDVLLDAAAMGINIVEREGLSISHPARFMLVGTMNPAEGELRPQLLDRFGLCVAVVGISDVEERVQIVDRRTEWDADPAAVNAEFARTEDALRGKIRGAIDRCQDVKVPRQIRSLIAHLSIAVKVDGHRADLVLARAAQAMAALEQAESVDRSHVATVADMVYVHRRPEAEDQVAIGQLITRVVSAEAKRARPGESKQPLPAVRPINI
jgi:magnesium chelatase subunit I